MTTVPEEPRPRCLRCLRPARMCLCDSLPIVPTRTKVLILQHPHERTHPFGTARLVRLCMPQARVVTAYSGLHGDLCCEVPVPDDAVVLYPHPLATDITTLPPLARPSTLIAIDGTWSHAKRLYKDNPWLQRLQHVRIHPEEPSRYRIRREPQADYVSTLEAIVLALRVLEPATTGLDTLVHAFDRMVDQQIEHVATVQRNQRTRVVRQRESRALSPLLRDPRLVIAYAESSLPAGERSAARELVQWVAVRVATGEVFEALLRPMGPGPGEAHLAHMGLSREALLGGESSTSARERFAQFLGGDAPVAAWTSTTLEWGGPLLPTNTPTTVLKTSYCNLRNRRAGYLEDVVTREGLSTFAIAIACRGRAQDRLGSALAVARWLRDQGPA